MSMFFWGFSGQIPKGAVTKKNPWLFALQIQGGPLLVINGVITPINRLIIG